MYKRILVPIDGSEHSLRALEVAKEIGEKFESEIYIYSVVQEISAIDPITTSYMITNRVPQGAVDVTKKILEDAKTKIENYKNEVHTDYEIGRPPELILRYADNKNVDLIVMSNRGLGAFSRTFLGSVSNKVLNSTDKSVLLVK
ncbi:universal stress protein [Miniphocaeibacter halophilus]|uniref:Universal stress protein n=1 Tax=Miniphocaeibacter halophilus TaxID=2931922 RepID=A0AC61MP47_9FIRM|nr:universal stress protein [Miniphocaeibacter halophilus]QQK07282.1 universal stress protein [Miniphocaeibacter halophilus]